MKQTISFFLQIKVKTLPSRIGCWDSNVQPLNLEFPSITIRPGLPSRALTVPLATYLGTFNCSICNVLLKRYISFPITLNYIDWYEIWLCWTNSIHLNFYLILFLSFWQNLAQVLMQNSRFTLSLHQRWIGSKSFVATVGALL